MVLKISRGIRNVINWELQNTALNKKDLPSDSSSSRALSL